MRDAAPPGRAPLRLPQAARHECCQVDDGAGRAGCGDTTLADSEIAGIALDADETAASVDGGDARGAAAHAVVEHHVARICIGPDQVFHQRDGLLGGVDGRAGRRNV
jgi:hypothetical protein